jgi:hypothetical protein
MEMTEAQRLWEAWMDALTKVLTSDSPVRCPSHDDGRVKVVFTGDPETRIGYYTAWCDACHEGIATDRAQAAPGTTILPFGLDPDERAKVVPADVQLLPPDPWLGDDVEQHTF